MEVIIIVGFVAIILQLNNIIRLLEELSKKITRL